MRGCMLIMAKAPFRISFGGGGTDVPPYCWEHGGAVISTTIDKYAYAVLKPLSADLIELHSIDFGLRRSFGLGRLEYDGELDLHKAVINEFGVKRGLELTTYADMPAASGMGTSSSMVVALIGCFREFLGKRMGARDVAELAYHIEREELKQKGGYQDQYAAAFGGFNYMELRKEGVTVSPIELPPDRSNELLSRLLLCFTGEMRLPAETLEAAAKRYRKRRGKIHEEMAKRHVEEDYLASMERLKRIASEMGRSLLGSHLRRFGELLHEGWVEKRGLSDRITNPEIDVLYELAREKGAVGGKLLGAGGGGYLLLFCEPERRSEIVGELNKYGVRMVPFAFEPKGLQTWRFGG